MTFLQPTENRRINEPVGFVLLFLAVALGVSFVSHHPFDPSWNVVGATDEPANLFGSPGAYISDLALQWLGLPAFLLPMSLLALAWRWVRSSPVPAPSARIIGLFLLLLVSCAALSLSPLQNLWMNTIDAGGVVGRLLVEALVGYLNLTGAILTLLAGAIVAPYLLTSSSLHGVLSWWASRRAQASLWRHSWQSWLQRQRERAARRRAARLRRKTRVEADGPIEEPPVVEVSDQAVTEPQLSAIEAENELPRSSPTKERRKSTAYRPTSRGRTIPRRQNLPRRKRTCRGNKKRPWPSRRELITSHRPCCSPPRPRELPTTRRSCRIVPAKSVPSSKSSASAAL